jgi:hypothetical protein
VGKTSVTANVNQSHRKAAFFRCLMIGINLDSLQFTRKISFGHRPRRAAKGAYMSGKFKIDDRVAK